MESRIRIPVTVSYSNFEEVDGIRRAMQVEVENPMSGKTVYTYDKIESGLTLADDVFTLNDPETPAAK
jgi:hypothetical protein